MKFLYNIFIWLYPKLAWLISGKSRKARLWVNGRKHIFEELETAFKDNKLPVVWMHCSSLGEFEQGRTVLEEMRLREERFKFGNAKFIVTFFSPSGYEVRKDYPGADDVFYLPMDSSENAKRFFDIVKPSLILFVKYEFWFYYLKEANQRKIPLLLVSGIFRKSQSFFKWYGGFYREMLQCFTHLFVQNQESFDLLKQINMQAYASIAGDTRFDRVIKIANEFKAIHSIEKFIGDSKVILAGSTWTEDDEELDHFANTHSEIKFIIAPHVIEEERLRECLKLYKHSVLWSSWESGGSQLSNNESINCLIIDNVGMLSKLYHYATIAYIGGAFGNDGVHNVLEAAVFGKPVVFGPVYEKYAEAVELIEADGAISIDNALELEKSLIEFLKKEEYYYSTAKNAASYVKSKAGATDKIVEWVTSNY